jgi:hypothetical protein
MGSARRPVEYAGRRDQSTPALMEVAVEWKDPCAGSDWCCDRTPRDYVLDVFQQNRTSPHCNSSWECCGDSNSSTGGSPGFSESHNVANRKQFRALFAFGYQGRQDCDCGGFVWIQASAAIGTQNCPGATVKLQILKRIGVYVAITAFQTGIFAQTVPLNSNSAVQNLWTGDTSRKESPSVRIDGGVVSREKFAFHWETRILPATPPLAEGFSTTTTDTFGVIHRVMMDRSGRTYFGYDVLIDVLPENNSYRITFKPLVMTSTLAKGLEMDQWSAWMTLAAPRFPAPQVVHGGDILEFTLLTNQATGQKISDYISVQEPRQSATTRGFAIEERDFTYETGTTRDITASDVELRIRSPRVSINSKLDPSSSDRFDEAAGVFVWIYVPGHGRFILSLLPHPGFSKTGEVRGSSLSFKDGTDTYSISAASRIAPGQAAFNLYVSHQPEWKPNYAFADVSKFNMGAEDRIESLIGK